MPIECEQLRGEPFAVEECRHCGEPFPEFMRGEVQSTWRRIIDEAGKNQETWELDHEDFLRLVADSVSLSQLTSEEAKQLN